MVYGWLSEKVSILKAFLRREGVGHAPEVSLGIRDPCSSRAGHSLY